MDRIYNGQEGTHDTPSQGAQEVDEAGDEEAAEGGGDLGGIKVYSV